jgi:hypothetical protein
LSRDLSDPKYNEDSTYWANPLETALPKAPDMSIYCLYGTGIDTERAYYYQEVQEGCAIPFSINNKYTSLVLICNKFEVICRIPK